MQTVSGDAANKQWQTYLSPGMVTSPYPAQIISNGCIMEKENLIIPHNRRTEHYFRMSLLA